MSRTDIAARGDQLARESRSEGTPGPGETSDVETAPWLEWNEPNVCRAPDFGEREGFDSYYHDRSREVLVEAIQ